MKKSSFRASRFVSSRLMSSHKNSTSHRRIIADAAKQLVDVLESRRLLSVSLTNGVLNLNGAGTADAYVLTKSGTNISVTENGGVAKTFAYASVTSINAILAGGNDTINIANSIVKPSYISGGSGADAIFGGGGDDTIDGGIGDDYIEGRSGNDTLSFASRSEAITSSISVHFAQSAADPLGFTVGAGGGAAGEHDTALTTEAIFGGSGNDTLNVYVDEWHGGDQYPNVPSLRLDGNGGNDDIQVWNAVEPTFKLSLGFPLTVANGGDGNDHFTITERSSSVTLNGGEGNDVFDKVDIEGSATVNPGSGVDTYNDYSESSHDFTMPADLENLFIKNAGRVVGNDLDNRITGRISNVHAEGGNDTIATTASSYINGGPGNDTITGSEYDDIIDGETGDDSIDGGGGSDTVLYETRTTPITASIGVSFTPVLASTSEYNVYTEVLTNLAGSGGAAGETDTYKNIETLTGGSGDDELSINSAQWDADQNQNHVSPTPPPVRVNGLGGSDTLYANGSTDYLATNNGFLQQIADGGEGNDVIQSYYSTLATTLIGGDGDDQFSSGDRATVDPGAGYDIYHYNSNHISGRSYTMPDGLEELSTDDGVFAQIIGNDLDNVIRTNAALIDGAGGNDTINVPYGDLDTTIVRGGAGNDTINASYVDAIYGDAGNDTINIIGPVHSVFGGDDNDRISSTGAANIFGGNGVDTIVYNAASFATTVDGGADADLITINEGDVTVISGAGDDVLNVTQLTYSNGTYTTPKVHLTQQETLAQLSIVGYGVVNVESSALEANALRVKSLSIGTGGKLNLFNNPLIVDYTGASPLKTIEALVRSGYDNGSGFGPGINSSSIKANPRVLGVAERTQVGSAFPALIGGAPVDNTSVVIRFTLKGDVNLDRIVNFDDLVLLSQNYNKIGQSYAQGNVNYSAGGEVNFDDVVVISQNYNTSMPSSVAAVMPAGASATKTTVTKKTPVAREVIS